jgi:hypothetical protein
VVTNGSSLLVYLYRLCCGTLLRCHFFRVFLSHMTTHHASTHSAKHCMMVSVMTRYAAYSGAFQAASCVRRSGERS